MQKQEKKYMINNYKTIQTNKIVKKILKKLTTLEKNVELIKNQILSNQINENNDKPEHVLNDIEMEQQEENSYTDEENEYKSIYNVLYDYGVLPKESLELFGDTDYTEYCDYTDEES